MNIYNGKITGPFASERQFKKAIIRFWEDTGRVDDVLEIENEEKAPGMPDVLCFAEGKCTLVEFKLSDSKSVIKFQRTQPLFYKQHPSLCIRILAWDAPRSSVVIIYPATIIAAKSLRYKIPIGDK
jgi:hypothetical protein